MATKDTTDFIAAVQEYIALVDQAGSLRAYDLLAKAAILLPRIYAGGMALPDVEPETEEPLTYEGPSVMGALAAKLGKHDYYFEIFDPTDDSDSVAGALSDDLADIYRDLKGPLLACDQGRCRDAKWQWKFNIQTHCGDHLVDALRVIHRLVNDHMDPDYVAEPDGVW